MLDPSGELTSEGYLPASFGFTYPKTSPDYRTREFKIYSTARTPQEIQEVTRICNCNLWK
jgi:hypothetical protein